MCGLCALLSADRNAAQHVEALEQSLQCMRHRGPDAAGTWHDDDAAFGFNRPPTSRCVGAPKTTRSATLSPSTARFITTSSCAKSSSPPATPLTPRAMVSPSSSATTTGART